MKPLIRIVKGLGALLAVAILLFLIVVNFGTVDSRLECPGEVQRQVGGGAAPVITPATLYAQVETYCWFIVWVDHDAMITWEIQPGGDNGFGYYRRSDFATPITDFYNTKIYGSFSTLSNRIDVETAFDGSETFGGVCR
jgi:hypothetical protein